MVVDLYKVRSQIKHKGEIGISHKKYRMTEDRQNQGTVIGIYATMGQDQGHLWKEATATREPPPPAAVY
jgi:hypothetical protein